MDKIKFKEKAIYYCLELLYFLILFSLLLYVKVNYSFPNEYETILFTIIVMFLFVLFWFLGPSLNRYVCSILTFLICLYFISQDVYYRAFNQYYRLNTIKSLYKEGLGAADSAIELINFVDYVPFAVLIICTIVFVFLYYYFQRKILKSFSFKYRIITKILPFLLLVPIYFQFAKYNDMLITEKKSIDAFELNKTDYYIYDVVPTTNQFVEKFSLLPLLYRDGISFFETDVISEGDYKRVDEFLSSRPEHQENAMTGIFEGKHVLFVMAESLNDVAIDEKLTPTLYKMKNEGININGFNTSTMTGSTSSSEFMANTSLVPLADGEAVCYKYPYNTYPLTLATVFNDLGYDTHAYHNNYGQYYNRDIVFPGLGYDRFFDCTELGMKDHNSDTTIMDVLKWIIVEYHEDWKYMGFWITYSAHQPYSFDSDGMYQENIEKVQSVYPNLPENYASYLAKNIDLDNALKDLLNTLENANKLDDFVIVVFGDHVVKGLDVSESSPYYSETGREPRKDGQNTDLFIYNSATEPFVYDKKATLLDLLPTIMNMWGVEVDYSKMLGTDIFDENYNGFFFGEWNFWATDDYVYDSFDDKLIIDNGYDEALARKEMDHYLEMMDVSRLILKLDYFKDEE